MAEINNNFFWIMTFLIIALLFLLTKDKISNILTPKSSFTDIRGISNSNLCEKGKCPPMRRDFKLSVQGPWKFDDTMILDSTNVEKNKNLQMEVMNMCYEDLENDLINYNYKPKNLFIIP